MPVDIHTGAAAEVQIGDHTLLSLASSIAAAKGKDKLEAWRHIIWCLRYAFICGCQKGVDDATRELKAAIPGRPAEDALRAHVDEARQLRQAERKGQVSHG